MPIDVRPIRVIFKMHVLETSWVPFWGSACEIDGGSFEGGWDGQISSCRHLLLVDLTQTPHNTAHIMQIGRAMVWKIHYQQETGNPLARALFLKYFPIVATVFPFNTRAILPVQPQRFNQALSHSVIPSIHHPTIRCLIEPRVPGSDPHPLASQWTRLQHEASGYHPAT